MPVDLPVPGVPSTREVRTEPHGVETSDPPGRGSGASGAVTGTLLGRWAMDARDGFLRVATANRRVARRRRAADLWSEGWVVQAIAAGQDAVVVTEGGPGGRRERRVRGGRRER